VIALITVFLLLFTSPAQAEHAQSCSGKVSVVPDDIKVICSATWRFRGNCTGDDMWDKWLVDGQTAPKFPFVSPWSSEPILIVGFELVKLRNAKWYEIPNRLWNSNREWLGVGSTVQADAMIWLGPGESHAKMIWAEGRGEPWPKAGDAAPIKPVQDAAGKMVAAGGDLLDLHGQCYGGSAIVYLTLYYTPIPDPEAGNETAEPRK
jgi:hypothetical protein